MTLSLLLPFATPGPLVPPSEIDEELVTPGVIGFIAIFLVAVATVLLIFDMVRRIRRTRYRGEIREQLEAERREAERREAERREAENTDDGEPR